MRALFYMVLLAAFLLPGVSRAAATSPKQEITQKETYKNAEEIPKVLLKGLSHGATSRSQYITELLEDLRGSDQDRQYITRTDIEALAQKAETRKRRQLYLSLISFDLDFNGTVTQQEVGQIMQEERRRQRRDIEGCQDEAGKFVSRYDTDKDGVISLKEMSTLPKTEQGRRDAGVRRLTALLALDPDHDGKLTSSELETLATKAFATLDVDADGMLSREESLDALDASEEY